MKEQLFKEVYPLHTLEIAKEETSYKTMDAIMNFLKMKISEQPVIAYIGVFDHYAHTASLEEGKIDPAICDAKNIIFCFGKELISPLILGVRPRSIGVAEMEHSFVLSFLEAPNPAANEAMRGWCKAIAKH